MVPAASVLAIHVAAAPFLLVGVRKLAGTAMWHRKQGEAFVLSMVLTLNKT
jgi:hypothetical protein